MLNKYTKQFLGIAAILMLTQSVKAQNLQLRSRIPYTYLSNIWGYVDTTGKEYALAGVNSGLSIVDVTNPDEPEEKFFVQGPNNNWREIRTYGKYAYVTTEGGGGVTIVDLRNLPASINTKQYTGNAGPSDGRIDQIHALHIDNGKLYLYGGNWQQGRAKIFSLADPWNPVYLGTVSNDYVHDGFVKNDTLYSCQIYGGVLEIIDARNPSSPVVINSQITPLEFTHNSWMSTDGKVIYTTDERDGSYVVAYDITNMGTNIKELDRYRHNNSGSIGHNTYVLNNQTITGHSTDFLWTSYYTDGVTVVDAARPDNLVEVGHYDTSPFSGGGFQGAWGVYPYLPSGNILVSDMERGMHVLTPTYKRASYLEGIITNSQTSMPVVGARLEVINSTIDELTNNSGIYKTGTVSEGSFTVRVSLLGYHTQEIQNVTFASGVVNTLNISLVPKSNFNYSSKVVDENGNSISNAKVILENADYKHELTSDLNGNVNVSMFYSGTYSLHAGRFGYNSLGDDSVQFNSSNDVTNIVLQKGYADDFYFDFGWMSSGTASNGLWERAVPIKTTYLGNTANPDFDSAVDMGDLCFVTRNLGGPASFGDVDNGTAILTSPVMNLSDLVNPYISYERWFANLSSNGSENDTFKVSISNGTQTAVMEEVVGNIPDKSQWVKKEYRILDYVSLSNNMRVIIQTGDQLLTDHIVEAGFDNMKISDSLAAGINTGKSKININVYPNPSNQQFNVSYSFPSLQNNAKVECFDVLGKQVFSKTLDRESGVVKLDVPAKGVYILRITNGHDQSSKTLIRN